MVALLADLDLLLSRRGFDDLDVLLQEPDEVYATSVTARAEAVRQFGDLAAARLVVGATHLGAPTRELDTTVSSVTHISKVRTYPRVLVLRADDNRVELLVNLDFEADFDGLPVSDLEATRDAEALEHLNGLANGVAEPLDGITTQRFMAEVERVFHVLDRAGLVVNLAARPQERWFDDIGLEPLASSKKQSVLSQFSIDFATWVPEIRVGVLA